MLRNLFERLPTLEDFAVCYLFRSIGAVNKDEMVAFMEGLEQQMSERMELANMEAKSDITQSGTHTPKIQML
jgi:hypothetical protein